MTLNGLSKTLKPKGTIKMFNNPLTNFDNYLRKLVKKYGISEITITLYSEGFKGHEKYKKAQLERAEAIQKECDRMEKIEDPSEKQIERHSKLIEYYYSSLLHPFELGIPKYLYIKTGWFENCKLDGNFFWDTYTSDQKWICDNLEYIEYQVKKHCEEELQRQKERKEEQLKVSSVCTRKITKFLKSR